MAKYLTQCCNQILESVRRHDFVGCKCGNSFVDGGDVYSRRGAKDGRFPLAIEAPDG